MPPEKQPPSRIDWNELIETALTVKGNMGSVYSRFYNYSFLNQMYLYIQGVAEPVATYKRWQAIGRQVLKGSKAKEIICPMVVKQKDGTGEEKEAVIGFKPVRCIFGLSETEGDELPPISLPEWDMDRALQKLDIRQVPFTQLNGNIQGVSRGREIAVNPVAVNRLKTLTHEMAHIVLGHTLPEAAERYATHRGIFEFQAEATALLTMNELETIAEETAARSRAYIQGWLDQDRPPETAIRQVFSATERILKAGRLAVDGANQEVE